MACRELSTRSRKRRGAFRGSCKEAGARAPRSERPRTHELLAIASDYQVASGPAHANNYLPLPTTIKLFFTEKILRTALARRYARFLSASLSTTPSSVTLPFFTMIWMYGTASIEPRERPE